MDEMVWLIRKTLKDTFRKKKNWFLYFGLPIVGILISLFFYSNASTGTIRAGVVNQDGSQVVTSGVIRYLEGLGQVQVTPLDEETLRARIASGDLDCGIIFEQGFADRVKTGEPGHIRIVSVKGESVTAYIKAMLQSYIGNVAAIGKETKGDEAAFARIYDSYSQQPFKLKATAQSDTSNEQMMSYQTIGYLITFMMFSAANLSEIILKEKENRTFLRLLSSPMSARAYVLSNVVVSLLLIFLQIVVTLVAMKLIFHIDVGMPTFPLIAVLLLFALTAIGLALTIVAFAKSTSAAGAMRNMIITPSCLLAGCYFPVNIMPETVRKISSFLPQHWLLDSIDQLQQGQSLGSLYVNLLILGGFALVFALIAVYRFGKNNDSRQFV
ncbi:ABC transporter permease [Brevibacillus parabrevis]|uniref:ABC transporter permease n=1 Tax=Brevibacillus parabrevis TaxID=54914 RepID=UPI0007AC00C3|nr:ABC transporter permease [Brevibacillus parabrevis]KZE46365.1 ABC transporter permease [Brevibacillus parabrevis]